MQGNQFSMPQKASLGVSPKEGPVTIPLNIDFTAQSSYQFDATYIQQKGYVSLLQSIYVDNSLANVPFIMQVATTNQIVKVPAYSEAYIPLPITNKLALNFSSGSGLVIPVQLMNIAINATVWSVNNPPSTNGSGALIVSDAALEAGVVSGYYQSLQFEEASGNAIMPQVAGTKLITGVLSTATATTLFTGAPGFQLTNLQVFASPNAILAAAGPITVTASESGVGNIAQGLAFLPTTAPTGLTGAVPIINIATKYTSKGSASNLQLTLSAVPTGGEVYYNAAYALTAFVGG
jgi:hypothetical protein